MCNNTAAILLKLFYKTIIKEVLDIKIVNKSVKSLSIFNYCLFDHLL